MPIELLAPAVAAESITSAGVAEVLRAIHLDGIVFLAVAPNPANDGRPLILLALNWGHGARDQGGAGAYKTDGPKLRHE